MGEKFEKGTLIVLILVFLVGAVLAVHAGKQRKEMEEIISIADGRTEYLLNVVEDLTKRVEKLEKVK